MDFSKTVAAIFEVRLQNRNPDIEDLHAYLDDKFYFVEEIRKVSLKISREELLSLSEYLAVAIAQKTTADLALLTLEVA